MDILSLLACFEPLVTSTSLRHFSIIVPTILSMTGRITMLGISRWAGKGGSYRTVNRFFATEFDWMKLLVKFFETHLFDLFDEWILVGDATTVTKSGTITHGIGRFFSGVAGRVVKGLEFFAFSPVNVRERKGYPVAVKQMVRSEAEKAAIKKRKKKRAKKKNRETRTKKSKPRGRAKGSKNKDKNEFTPSPELFRINSLLQSLLKLLRRFIAIKYLALDGHFGHNQAVLMARLNDLHLISKLRSDAALWEKFTGKQNARGPKIKYGDKIDYDNLPQKYWKCVPREREGENVTNYYQAILLHKKFGCELNVVIIERINVRTKKVGHAILFSSDLELEWEKLIDYYSLRFQIEFNFRDAKQHFGLEDFMTTTKTGVENAANLSFMMVNISAKLIKESEEKCVGVLDLKTHYRGVKYLTEAIKILQEKAETIIKKEAIEEATERISQLGSIHQRKVAYFTP